MMMRTTCAVLALCGAARAASCELETKLDFSVEAVVTTKLFEDTDVPGAPDADDAAVIYNASAPEESLVLGTLKEGGLAVFGLDGATKEVLSYDGARFNNVAVVDVQGRQVAVVSDRGLDLLRFFELGQEGKLEEVTSSSSQLVFSSDENEVQNQTTAYGLTAAKFEGVSYVFVSQRARALVKRFTLSVDAAGKIAYTEAGEVELANEFELKDKSIWSPCVEDEGEKPQIEGMVLDEKSGVLMIAQETVGLWLTNVNFSTPELIDRVTAFGAKYSIDSEGDCVYEKNTSGEGGNIEADAEGMSLFTGAEGFYVLSSQGGNRYELYAREGYAHLGHFKITFDGTDVEETDGVEVFNQPLGPKFPAGALIVQDEDEGSLTSFKFVSIKDVADKVTAACTPEVEEEDEKEDEKEDDPGLTNGAKAGLALGFFFGVSIVLFIGLWKFSPKEAEQDMLINTEQRTQDGEEAV